MLFFVERECGGEIQRESPSMERLEIRERLPLICVSSQNAINKEITEFFPAESRAINQVPIHQEQD